MNAAIILAGGSGERLSELKFPKQFIGVSGSPLIMYSLVTFQKCEYISTIAVVASQEWHEQLTRWIDSYGIFKFKLFALPGQTRQQSIYNGLLALSGALCDADRVVIHDAARPLVMVEDIYDCVKFANGYDGATPAIGVTDTIYKSVDGAAISALLNRDELFAGQTPECYDYGKYLAAHQKLSDEEIRNIRGSSEIAFKSGMKVRLYAGNLNNFKITTASDLEYFKYIKGDSE